MLENLKIRKEIKNCVHKKNIYSFIDLSPADEQYSQLNSHLKSCLICQNELNLFKEKVMASHVFIPKPIMDKELKQTFDREMHELLINLGYNESRNRQNKFFEFLSQANKFGEDMIKLLSKPTMLASYVIGGVLYLIMRHKP